MIHHLWSLRLRALSPKLSTDASTAPEPHSQLFSSQFFSSQSSAATSDPDAPHPRQRKARHDYSTASTPRLIDTLALLYLAMLILRLPPSLADLLRWANSGALAYYRAIRAVPREMRHALPVQYAHALDPDALLRPDALRMAVQRLVGAYRRDFGLEVPGVNVPLVLWRYVGELGMPLDVYPAARRVGGLVEWSFGFPGAAVEMGKRRRVADSPEVQLMACVVVAVKMLFPFHEGEGGQKVQTDGKTGLVRVDWDEWESAQAEYEEALERPRRLGFEDAMRASEEDVFGMTDVQMDDYLDWYEDTWVEQEESAKAKGAHSTTSGRPARDEADRKNAHAQKLNAVQGAMKPRQQASEPRKQRNYRLYRTAEELAHDARAKRFYDVAATVAGLSLETLVKGVYLTESKLFQKMRDEKRRRVEEDLEEG
ncbi:hypothetical protein W97_02902 [Coniosporium apollinis CBS 100218]|uniref:Uncharacterized protein n=1 Tax=Coniosporium apollinis (strain CBS 100218) TaxID=1168221 RepID=R7YPE5_CONA1|nr:uncharacterized protein W97_02902 [Coniosporium apollinis CBS 100218]EON63674.1 hypothetical protein W97_02902 [Coniosporium apollinis CBS 100218]